MPISSTRLRVALAAGSGLGLCLPCWELLFGSATSTWTCNCVIPGERGTPIHKRGRLRPGWHEQPRHPHPAQPKTQQSSTRSTFSNSSSCDSACP